MWENEEIDLVKTSVFSLVLETVKRFDERFWVTMITKILSWSEDKKILDYSLDENEFFWALSDFSVEMIQSIIEALIFKNFLHKTEGNYPVLWISEKWRIAIVRAYLLSDENKDLQYFIRKKIWNKKIFKKQEKNSEKNLAEKKEKIDTFLETLKIFEKLKKTGETEKNILKKISEERNLALQTIESHFLKLYEIWQISLFDILKFSDLEKLKIIKKIILEEVDSDISKLKPIKEKLDTIWKNNINYFDIKIAILMMEKKDL